MSDPTYTVPPTTPQTYEVSPGFGAAPMAAGDGMTQAQADARYVRLSAVNQPNGVAGLDANGSLTAPITWASTDW